MRRCWLLMSKLPMQPRMIRRLSWITIISCLIAYCVLIVGFVVLEFMAFAQYRVSLMRAALPSLVVGTVLLLTLAIIAWFVQACLRDEVGTDADMVRVFIDHSKILRWYKRAILCAQCTGILLTSAAITARMDAYLLSVIQVIILTVLVVRYFRSSDRRAAILMLNKMAQTWCSISINSTFLFAQILTSLCALIVIKELTPALLTHPLTVSLLLFAAISFYSQSYLHRYLMHQSLD